MRKVAAADAPVLITGESGTGKELVAHAVHAHSRRGDQPFIAVNCVSLSPSLIHAELFGFERGAFTGAHRQKRGQFELADGATILLDEIGDLHLELQSLLLRFLEEHLLRRVGGQEQIPVDVRVLAATNVDLEAAVRAGRFREDLYYRLNVLRIVTPPLREHREDIEALAHEFLQRFVSRKGGRAIGFTKSALTALRAHHWPGNVRELVNRVHRASVMCDGRMVTPADLQLSSIGSRAGSEPRCGRCTCRARNRLAALQLTGWNASRAALHHGYLASHALPPDREARARATFARYRRHDRFDPAPRSSSALRFRLKTKTALHSCNDPLSHQRVGKRSPLPPFSIVIQVHARPSTVI